MAGCTLSTSLSKAYIRPAIRSVEEVQGHEICEHVDDVSQLTIKHNTISALMTAVTQGSRLAAGLEATDLKISDKSVVIANVPGLASRVARQLRNKGFPVNAAIQSEDLGVSTRGGNVRTTRSMEDWIGKASKRARIV